MHPILLTLGKINLYSFSVFLILAWLIFSFLFCGGLIFANITLYQIKDYYPIILATILLIIFLFILSCLQIWFKIKIKLRKKYKRKII